MVAHVAAGQGGWSIMDGKKKRQRTRPKKAANGKPVAPPKILALRGKGNYFGKIKSFLQENVPKGVAAGLGAKIGSLFGPAGTALGGLAGSLFSKITGVGDYQMSGSPTSLAFLAQSPPIFSNVPGSTRLRHREFIANVVTSATPNAFLNTAYPINIGIAGTFPWGASVAGSWREYCMEGLVFEYRATSGTQGTGLGSVIMSTQYNSYELPYNSKVEMEVTDMAGSCVPYQSMLHGVECAKSQNPLCDQYIRDGFGAAPGDLRMSDLGIFNIATQGNPNASATVGELWVSYDVTFRKTAFKSTAGVIGVWSDSGPRTVATALNFLGPKPDNTLILGGSGGLSLGLLAVPAGIYRFILTGHTSLGGGFAFGTALAPWTIGGAVDAQPVGFNNTYVGDAGSDFVVTTGIFVVTVPGLVTLTQTANMTSMWTPPALNSLIDIRLEIVKIIN